MWETYNTLTISFRKQELSTRSLQLRCSYRRGSIFTFEITERLCLETSSDASNGTGIFISWSFGPFFSWNGRIWCNLRSLYFKFILIYISSVYDFISKWNYQNRLEVLCQIQYQIASTWESLIRVEDSAPASCLRTSTT